MAPLVVGVPGPWTGPEDVIRAFVEHGGMPPRFLFAGKLLMELETRQSIGVDMYGPNPQLVDIMVRSSGGSIDEDVARRIAGHQSTIYLVSDDHDVDKARLLQRAASFLLDCGGYAVKVESAGMAVGPERWRNLASRGTTVALMESMVTLVGGEEDCYSCGMHHLGLPDCAVSTQVPGSEIATMITTFNHWQLHGDGEPAEGALFATELDGLVLRMTRQPFGYEADNPMNNPFGRWYLEPTDQPLALAPAFEGGGTAMLMVPSNDPRMAAAREQARASIGHFLAWARDPDDYGMGMFKIPLTESGRTHHMWLALVEADNETVTGRLFQLPPGFTGVSLERPITVPVEEVEDWSIRKCGLAVGAFTMRVTREGLPPESVLHYDLYCGNLAYTPVEELVPAG